MSYYLFFNNEPLDIALFSINIPEPPAEYNAQDIKRIREENHYSQGIFAKILNVSIKTVRSWESGARVPSQAALRLLEIVDKGFYRPIIVKSIFQTS